MKQVEDKDTLELPNVGPYLVLTTTKKGFREFKTDWISRYGGRSSWDSRIEKAHRFAMADLEQLLKFAWASNKVTVALVSGDEYIVLGQSRFPVELATKRRYLR